MESIKIEQIEVFVSRALQRYIDECAILASRRGSAEGTLQQLYAVSVYFTILDVARDTLDLIKKRRRTSSAILLRSLLEAYICLLNIIKDKEYLNKMFNSSAKEQRKILERAATLTSPLFGEFRKHPEAARRKQEQLDDLLSDGPQTVTIRDRFKQVGMDCYYEAIYTVLSAEAHHDMLMLEERHLNVKELEKRCTVGFPKALDTEGILRNISLLADIILNASIQTHCLLDSPRLDVLKKLKEEYSELTQP